MVDRLVVLERLLHLRDVIIDRAAVSSYVPDSQPYDPDTLTTFPYSLPGQRSASGEVLPLELCLFIRRNVNFGRDGRLLYRGCLTEGDMSASAFRPLLTKRHKQLVSTRYKPRLGFGNGFWHSTTYKY
jgi:hypothetical protein